MGKMKHKLIFGIGILCEAFYILMLLLKKYDADSFTVGIGAVIWFDLIKESWKHIHDNE